jgi:hypothetical protein
MAYTAPNALIAPLPPKILDTTVEFVPVRGEIARYDPTPMREIPAMNAAILRKNTDVKLRWETLTIGAKYSSKTESVFTEALIPWL